MAEKLDFILVYGDTNRTLAGALVAAKMNIKLIHIETGIEKLNLTMPEEVKRIVADRFANLLFCPTQSSLKNLRNEGIDHSGIFLSWDVMCNILYIKLLKNCLLNITRT